MKKNKIFLIIGIIAVAFTMVGLDMYKSYIEEKPPLPQITIGNEQIDAYLGPYVWNAGPMNEVERADLLRDKENHIVNPIEDLYIQFPEDQPAIIEVLYTERYIDNEWSTQSKFIDDQLQVNIPNEPRTSVLTIKAEWEGEKRAEYYVPMKVIEASPYQYFLPEEEGQYSLIYFYDDKNYINNPNYRSPIHLRILPIQFYHGFSHKESFQFTFPDLQIIDNEGYWVFDKKGIVFETNSIDELINFFAETFEPATIDFFGLVTEIDFETNIVYFNSIRLYIEDIDEIKVGQNIRANVTYHDLFDETNVTVHHMQIVNEQPEGLQDPKWFASKDGAYTLLCIATEDYLEYVAEDEVKHLVETFHKEVMKSNREYSPLSYSFIIFDHQGPVFISYRWDEIKGYLTNAINN